jgi:copper chaperone CopZ
MITKTYQIEGMHCTSCSILIEGELEDIGVNATVNYAKAEVTVTFDPERISERKILEVIRQAGYSAKPLQGM